MRSRSIPVCGTVSSGGVHGIARWPADAAITAEQATQMRADLPEPTHFNQLDVVGDALSSAEDVVTYDIPHGISRDVRLMNVGQRR